MAKILPDTPPQNIPPEVFKAFRALKTLPDSNYVWHHLAPWQEEAPDFLLITADDRALLIKVSLASSQQAVPAAQLFLLDDDRPPPGVPEAAVLDSFRRSLRLPADIQPGFLILFPNISHRQVLESRRADYPPEYQWAGRELLQPDSEMNWDEFLPAAPMNPLWLEKVRQQFTPEVLIPPEMTVRPQTERRLKAGLTNYLLDIDQEAVVKNDLWLDPEAQALGNDFRLNIINGVAGSGKTLILLYRLRILYHLYPARQFLVLTHNRPLNHDMQSRFYRLEKCLPDNIQWQTFTAWCLHLLPEKFKNIKPISNNQREEITAGITQQYLTGTSITARMLSSEIDWVKDQIPLTLEQYLQADRRGRVFSLNSEQRERVWAAISAYQQTLHARGQVDWSDIPQLLWQSIQQGQTVLPQYDHIFIDEAQFFAPLWMSLIQKALKTRNAHLFLVADPTQGFLGRKASWKSLGLEARGRTHLLRRSYRTTREILRFANLFYRLRLADEKDEDILTPDLFNMPNGAIPEALSLASSQDEISRVVNEVVELRRSHFPARDLLLLHVSQHGVDTLIQSINQHLGKDAAMNPKDNAPANYIRVTTLNAGAGLESPIVFLVGLRDLFEREQSLRLSEEERDALIHDNTRKIYMAATRAGQRLVFTCVGELPELFRRALEMQKEDEG